MIVFVLLSIYAFLNWQTFLKNCCKTFIIFDFNLFWQNLSFYNEYIIIHCQKVVLFVQSFFLKWNMHVNHWWLQYSIGLDQIHHDSFIIYWTISICRWFVAIIAEIHYHLKHLFVWQWECYICILHEASYWKNGHPRNEWNEVTIMSDSHFEENWICLSSNSD